MKRVLYLMAFLSIPFIAFCQQELNYSSGAISLGVVVSDFDRSYAFYTETLGMQKTGSFSIDDNFASVSGLSRGVPFDVTVLKTMNNESATELKLVSFKGQATHPKQNNIQDDVGVQYMTLFVEEMAPFIERIRQAYIPFLGQTPTTLGDGRSFVLIQDPDGTFVELIGPMNK